MIDSECLDDSGDEAVRWLTNFVDRGGNETPVKDINLDIDSGDELSATTAQTVLVSLSALIDSLSLCSTKQTTLKEQIHAFKHCH